jgi:hypothetical protein
MMIKAIALLLVLNPFNETDPVILVCDTVIETYPLRVSGLADVQERCTALPNNNFIRPDQPQHIAGLLVEQVEV